MWTKMKNMILAQVLPLLIYFAIFQLIMRILTWILTLCSALVVPEMAGGMSLPVIAVLSLMLAKKIWDYYFKR